MRTIDVYPNPFIALDADGVPQGTVCVPGSPTSHIGALLDLVATQKSGKERFYFPLGKKEGKYTVPLSGEIAHAVRAGELLAADEKSAAACGITAKEFLPYDKVLAAEKEKALSYLRAVKGPDATLGDIPREATPPEPAGDEGDDGVPNALRQLTPTLTEEH